MESNYVIKTKNLSFFRYSNVNWKLRKGEIHAVVGASGVGKSTFLRLFLGLTKFEGEILDENDENWNVGKKNIAVQFQNPALLSHLSLGANIYLPLCMKYDVMTEIAEYIAYEYMKKVSLSLEDFRKLPAECSGGMQKRASLARALILSPEILFLDEPTSGLDIKSSSQYDILIKNLKEESNLTILMVTHDLERVEKVADMVTIISKEGIITETFSNLKNNANIRVKEFFKYYG